MEQMVLEYGLSKETVTAVMMLYKITKAMVHSPDGDIVVGVLQGHILALYLFIICTSNVDRSNKTK